MNTKSKIMIAALISLLIWFPTDVCFLLTVAHLMMITEQTFVSYLISASIWGIVAEIPFLVLILKSHFTIIKKIVLILVMTIFFALLRISLYILTNIFYELMYYWHNPL